MYRCAECDMEFENAKPFTADDFELELYDGRPSCPYCGSIDIRKLHMCECCTEWTDGVLCHNCSDMAEDIIKYAKDRFKLEVGDLDWLIATYREEGRWKRS